MEQTGGRRYIGNIVRKEDKILVIPNKNCKVCFGRGIEGKNEKGEDVPCHKCKKLYLKK